MKSNRSTLLDGDRESPFDMSFLAAYISTAQKSHGMQSYKKDTKQ